MSPIRPLERGDLPEVCRLYERVVRGSSSDDPPSQLVPYFERTLFDHPWVDPDIPSLLYCHGDGRIGAFVGSHVRRLRFGDRAIRVACTGQFVADNAPEDHAASALLARAFLKGPQDLTITDGATEKVRVIWEKLGGHSLGHCSIGWTRVFRPAEMTSKVLARLNAPSSLVRSVRALSPALDAAARALPRGDVLFPSRPVGHSESLGIDTLISVLKELGHLFALRPEYDEAFLKWLVREVAAVDVRGTPVWNVVRAPDGRVVGWYVYYLARGGIAQTLQVAAPSEDAGMVLDHLFWHAANGGAAAIGGRVEPALLGPLSQRHVVLRRSEWALVYSNQVEILAVLGCGGALLSRLDGEWWMGHHVLWRSDQARRRGQPRAPV